MKHTLTWPLLALCLLIEYCDESVADVKSNSIQPTLPDTISLDTVGPNENSEQGPLNMLPIAGKDAQPSGHYAGDFTHGPHVGVCDIEIQFFDESYQPVENHESAYGVTIVGQISGTYGRS